MLSGLTTKIFKSDARIGYDEEIVQFCVFIFLSGILPLVKIADQGFLIMEEHDARRNEFWNHG